MGKFALLVGVSESKELSEEDLPALPSALNDIQAIQEVLQNPELGGFDHVNTLANPTRQETEDIEPIHRKLDVAIVLTELPSVPDEAKALPVNESDLTDNLASEKGIDYTRLRDLLAAGNWKEADEETYKVMIRAVGKKSGDWFTKDELFNFPCTDLKTIDSLWVKYSKGKFGFSVQKRIWKECGSPRSSGKRWDHFCERVGWQVNGEWLDYNPSLSSSQGNLPLVNSSPKFSWLIPGFGDWGVFLFLLAHRDL